MRWTSPIEGKVLGRNASIIKIFGSELLQALNDLLMEAAGSHASTEKPITTDFGAVDVSTPFLQVRRATIYRRLLRDPA